MANIITIEREYGCGAPAIACKIADRLGYKLWDHALTEEIAKRLRCSVAAVEQREERPDPTYYRLFKTFMRGSYEDRTGIGVETLDAEGLSRLYETVINELANKGKCVIVGRAAPWFLRDRKDTFSVFLFASREEKLRRLMVKGKTQQEAEHLVDTVDAERAAYVKKYHDMTWPTRWLYNVMINTKAGDDAVVDLILGQAAKL